MEQKLKRLRWQWFLMKSQKQVQAGIKKGQISFYNEKLIEQLRHVDLFGVPASVLLLSRKFCNSRCHECAYLMAKAFFKTNVEVRVYDAKVDSLQLKNFDGADHNAIYWRAK